jgi:spore germination cell wall hydrolase CwlJ-like protein
MFSAHAFSATDSEILTSIAWSEARGEGSCAVYVMDVLMNRTKNKKFPKTLFKNVTKKGAFDGWRGSLIKKPKDKRYQELLTVANNFLNKGKGKGITHGALFFRNRNARFERSLERKIQLTTVCKQHNFYRF